jgi:dihydroflavonol-4-reductase
VLIHSAALISLQKRNKMCERVNLEGARNILDACKKYGVRRLVYFSSVDALPPVPDGTVLFEPDSFSPELLPTAYGRSKAAAAQLVLDAAARGLDCALLLPSAVIGPGDYKKGFITQILGMYVRGLPRLSVAGGYEFVDVRDVAAAAIEACKKRGRGDLYILSNRYADFTYVFDTLAKTLGRKPTRYTLPLWILYPLIPLVAAAYRIARREPPMTFGAVRLMRAHPAYSHEKAARELGFSPRPLEETLKDTAGFLLERRGGAR